MALLSHSGTSEATQFCHQRSSNAAASRITIEVPSYTDGSTNTFISAHKMSLLSQWPETKHLRHILIVPHPIAGPRIIASSLIFMTINNKSKISYIYSLIKAVAFITSECRLDHLTLNQCLFSPHLHKGTQLYRTSHLMKNMSPL